MKRKHNERKLIRLALGALLAGSLLYAPDVAMAGVTTTVTDADLGANNQTVYGNNNGTDFKNPDYNNTTNNHLTINASQYSIYNAYGCYSGNANDVTGNTLEVVNGNFSGANNFTGVYKNYSTPAATSYSNNTVYIRGGDFTTLETIYGVNLNNPGTAEVANNHLIIAGGSFKNGVTLTMQVQGTYSGNFKDNSISILVPLTDTYINFDRKGNNTLNVGAVGVTATYVANTTNYNFYLPATVQAGDRMLTITYANPYDVTGAKW